MKNVYKYFLIPIIVGFITALIQFFLPFVFGEKKELTYNIYEPITYFDKNSLGDLNIVINGIKTNALFSNQFIFENTGQVPLKDIPITIHFDVQDTLFKIYNYTIQTEPQLEFGNIEKHLKQNDLSLKIELINPKERIFVIVFTNDKKESNVYAKSENMILSKAEKKDNKEEKNFSFWLVLFASVLSTLFASIITKKTINTISDLSKFTDSLFKAKHQSGLKIVSALYGKNDTYIDITERLNQKIENNKLNVKATNELAGKDPLQNVKKEIKIIYSIGSKIETMVVDETQDLIIPLNKNNAT